MIVVLDTTAILATLFGEPAAHEVAPLLCDPDVDVRLSAVNLGEVVDILVRREGLAEDAITERIELFDASGLSVVPVDASLALLAGQLRGRYWNRDTCRVSLADCCAVATAQRLGARIATSDSAMTLVAAAEGVGLMALPDSKSGRPSA